jgi:hypothetical protein
MIYDKLLSVYDISPNNYARAYDTISEESMMKLIFSKFIHDKQASSVNKKYIDYILKYNFIQFYEAEEILQNNTYYLENFQKILDASPEENREIVDFDISRYASETIKQYFFYIDIISQIYDNVSTMKTGKLGIAPNEITLRCRYIPTPNDNKLLKLYDGHASGYFTMTLKITRLNNLQNDVSDIQFITNQNISFTEHTNLFKADIIKHLQYLNTGNDIKYATVAYLQNIRDFYRLCRLKLMYLVPHSIYLLTQQPAVKISEKVMYYIRQYVLPVFINMKNNFSNSVQQQTVTTDYNDMVFDKTNKLAKINEKLLKSKYRLLKNKRQHDYISQNVAYQKTFTTVANVVFGIVILLSLVIIAANVSMETKRFIFIILAILVLIVILVFYFMLNKVVFEKFEGPGVLTKYPKVAVQANEFNYNETPVRVDASSIAMSAFLAFNNSPSDSWVSGGPEVGGTYLNGNAKNTYKQSYNGEYLKIDLGEYMVLKNYTIKFNTPECGPKKFRIYGANSNVGWTDINHNVWQQLDNQDNIIYSTGMSQQFNLTTNTIPNRYYMMVVNKITGTTSNRVNISEWELNGTREQKEAIISSGAKSVSANQTLIQLQPMQLPHDYDDKGLISWDLKVNCRKTTVSAVLDGLVIVNTSPQLSEITITNSENQEITVSQTFNDTVMLNAFRSGTVDAYITLYQPVLSNYNYEIKLRYYPVVPDKEKEELIVQNIAATLGPPSAIQKAIQYATNATARYQAAQAAIAASNILFIDNKNLIERQISTLRGQLVNNVHEAQGILESCNLVYSQNEQVIANKLIEFAMSSSNLGISSNIYMQTSNYILDTGANVNQLNMQRVDVITKFKQYLSISQQTSDAEVYKLQADLAQANTSISPSTQNYYSDIASINMEKLQADERTAKASAEIAYLAYYRVRETALQEQNDAIEKAAELLAQLNEKYNLNETNVDNMLQAIKTKYETDKAYTDQYNADTKALQQSESDYIQLKAFADTSILTYDTYITDSEALVLSLEALLLDSRRNRDSILAEKQRLERELATAEGWSRGMLNAAQSRIDALILRKNIQIQDLKLQKQDLDDEFGREFKTKEEKFQEELREKQHYEDLPSLLASKVEAKKLQIEEADYYKEVTGDYEISNIFNDMDMQVMYNINDSVSGLNYEMIKPVLNKEYDQYNKTSTAIEAHTASSNQNLNIKQLEAYYYKAYTNLVIRISLIMCISMILYYSNNPRTAVAIAIIGITIVLTIYNVELQVRVRTKYKNKYWTQPLSYVNRISPP